MSNTKEHAKITVIEAEEGGQKKPKFRDNEGDHGFEITTSVYAGGTVEWTADTASGVKKISSIHFNPKDNIFESGPTPSDDKTIYRAVVKSDVSGKFVYYVRCVFSNDEENTADGIGADQGPALKIDPPGNE